MKAAIVCLVLLAVAIGIGHFAKPGPVSTDYFQRVAGSAK